MLLPEATYQVGTIKFDTTELKNYLQSELKKYNVAIEEDDLNSAKTMRATLNKARKTIDDERKRIKSLYCVPLIEFENDVKELTSMIGTAVNQIDVQIKEIEQKQKYEKAERIKDFFVGFATYDNGYVFPLDYDKFIFNPKWLNKTVGFDVIEQDIKSIFEKMSRDKDYLDLLCVGLDDMTKKQAVDEYVETFDIGRAKARIDYLARIKQEQQDRQMAERRYEKSKEEKVEEVKPTKTVSEEIELTRMFVLTGSYDMFVEITNIINEHKGKVEKLIKDRKEIERYL